MENQERRSREKKTHGGPSGTKREPELTQLARPASCGKGVWWALFVASKCARKRHFGSCVEGTPSAQRQQVAVGAGGKRTFASRPHALFVCCPRESVSYVAAWSGGPAQSGAHTRPDGRASPYERARP